MLVVRLLGPFEVSLDDRPVVLPAGRLRAMLAVLAMAAGEPVGIERIAAAVWGEDQPLEPRRAVHTNIRRLRTLIGEDAITTDSNGYRLDCAPDQVDACKLLRLTGAAEVSRADLVEAAGLWRGTPFEGLGSPYLADTDGPRLTDAYLTAVERRVDLDLAEGRSELPAGELRALVSQHPLREPLWLRLLLVLERSGRHAEALELYEQLRVRLADELGADPGPELRAVHARLLGAGDDTVAEGPAVPRQLPVDIGGFTGRTDELRQLDGLLDDGLLDDGHGAVVAVLDGAGGVGKTVLAVHWAHRVRERFAGGQLFADLRGFGPDEPADPAAVLEQLLLALGVAADRIPAGLEARNGLFRTTLAGRRVLLVLDNARDTAQVRPLLPGATSMALVTSRDQLRGLSVREGARRIALDRMAPAEATELLSTAMVAQGMDPDHDTLAVLAELCDRLPLALAIAAERASRMAGSAEHLVGELRDERTRLDALSTPDDPLTSVRAVLSASYGALDPPAARLFRLLGLQPPAGFSSAPATALAGTDLATGRRLLDRLVAAHLVQQTAADRFRLHDLVHTFAAELTAAVDDERDRDGAIRAALAWWLHTAHNALALARTAFRLSLDDVAEPGVPPLEFGAVPETVAWAQTEREAFAAWVRLADATGHSDDAWRLAWLFRPMLELTGHLDDGIAMARLAVRAAARVGDPLAEFRAINLLGVAWQVARRYPEAREAFEQARRLAHEQGDRSAECVVLSNLATAHLVDGQPGAAIEQLETALALGAEPPGPADGKLLLIPVRRDQLLNLGAACFFTQDYAASVRYSEQALRESRETGDWFREQQALCNLAEAHEAAGNLAEAEAYCDEALAGMTAASAPQAALEVLLVKGRVLAATGRPAAAYRAWRQALDDLPEGYDARRAELAALIDGLGPEPVQHLHG